jgi:hypothetical protein
MRRLASGTAAALLLWSVSVVGPRATAAAPLEPATPSAPTITSTASDDLPNALIFATHNLNPGGLSAIYHYSAVGVDFHSGILGLGPAGVSGNWGLYNESGASFDASDAFNLMITPAGDRAFIHTSVLSNTIGSNTLIDNVWLNGRIDRIPFIIHNYSPNSVNSGVVLSHSLGVYYDFLYQQWGIFNEDSASMPTNASFNVMVGLPGVQVGQPGVAVFTHTATVSNVGGSTTIIDHPLTNSNRNALILVTQSLNPDGGLGVFNPHNVGVFYFAAGDKWGIYNEDGAAMPVGASFSVLVEVLHNYLPLSLR